MITKLFFFQELLCIMYYIVIVYSNDKPCRNQNLLVVIE